MADGLRRDASEGLEDAFLALLLLMCRKLQRIHLQTPVEFTLTQVSAVIDWAVEDPDSQASIVRPRPLQRVHEIAVERWDTEGTTRMAQIAAVLQLPALATLRGTNLEIDDPPSPSSLVPSTLKWLHLEFSLLSAAGVDWLLARCPSLEKLYVHWGGPIVGVCSIEYDKISAAIDRRGRNLQFLRLDPAYTDPTDVGPLPIGSLQQVASLRTLTLPGDALFGDQADTEDEHSTLLTDLLPFSLETLRITQADDDDAEYHDELLWSVVTDERFAALKTIRINRSEAFSEDFSGSAWDDSGSNRFWVVLKRQ
ncbi:hypothetical protein LTR09_002928 [Extremus antarcticus]|uniref:Uncharacterized protein n=1 Tax=Extremus antarcticus TaxID=702011 RepID=A0AAJ0LV28_9PEZI|nr:hypothetical protein LTR09_002928 [Extremus antarcticus]